MARRRKSGSGTVRERKDGRWEGRIVIGYDERGLPKTKNVLAKTKTECLEKLETLKETIGATEITRCMPEMPFGEWIDFWYQNYCKPALRPYTQTTYEQRIYNQIIPKIGNVPLSQVTAGTLEKFYAHLKTDGRLVRREIYGEGLANSVIRSIHAHCRASLEKAKAEGLIRQNPAVHCKLPPKKSAEVEVLTVDEMQRLLIQAKEEGFYEMFLLDLSTGLRRGELLALMWDDINLETGELKVSKQVRYFNKELHIMPPKTKAGYRTIILPLPLIEMLKEYRKKVRSKWLFPSPYKREQDLPRDPCACRKKLSQILEHAGCKQVPFHALRHTFATQALRYGMDVKTLACTIGHESVETTVDIQNLHNIHFKATWLYAVLNLTKHSFFNMLQLARYPVNQISINIYAYTRDRKPNRCKYRVNLSKVVFLLIHFCYSLDLHSVAIAGYPPSSNHIFLLECSTFHDRLHFLPPTFRAYQTRKFDRR